MKRGFKENKQVSYKAKENKNMGNSKLRITQKIGEEEVKEF